MISITWNYPNQQLYLPDIQKRPLKIFGNARLGHPQSKILQFLDNRKLVNINAWLKTPTLCTMVAKTMWQKLQITFFVALKCLNCTFSKYIVIYGESLCFLLCKSLDTMSSLLTIPLGLRYFLLYEKKISYFHNCFLKFKSNR